MEPTGIVPTEIKSLPQALAFIDELLVIIGQQQARIEVLEAEVKRLQDHQQLDSHNSSLPPSTDKGRQKRTASQNVRQPSGRQPGGQKGHPGSTLTQVASPDEIISHPVSVCSRCGQALSQVAAIGVEKRQVFDMPPLKLVVIEHQAEIKTCPQCAQRTTGDFPSDVNQPVQYGPRVKGLLVYLNHGQLIPYDRTTTLFEDLFGQPISQGTLLNINQQGYTRLAAPEAQIKQDIHQSDVVHFDETGLYEQGRRIWLHAASTDNQTYYFAHEKRGQLGMEAAGILPNFEGTAVHDHWESYQAFDTCDHAFCNSHHVRELTRAIEQDDAEWAKALKHLLLEIKETVDTAKAQGHPHLSPEQIDLFNDRYRDIVDRALTPYLKEPSSNAPPKRGRKKQSQTKNLLDRFDTYQTETLRFMTDFRVPFDNNQAERDIRMIKVKQKISGTFRSENGTHYFCRIRGYISTLKKQGQNILEALTQIFTPNQEAV
jgi:transposase